MKTTTITHQEELEMHAINTMIAFGKQLVSEHETLQAITNALQHYGNAEGHWTIAVKGWVIKTIYALDREQLRHLEMILSKYITTEY